MSSEEAQQNGSAAVVDQNAQAKADVDNMLAQLEAKKAAAAAAPETASEEKTQEANGESDKKQDDSYRREREDRNRERERDGRPGDRQSFRGRGRGRGGFEKRNNNRFDPSTQGESDDPVAIRKQVEFYFSDSNLPLDKFMFNKVGGTENNAVELETICSFKRMRHFQPRSAIVAALKESSMLEVVEDDTKVKRKVPLSEELANADNETVVKIFEDRAMPRSIYVKGFGQEQPSTQFDIEAFFAPYGPTNAIRLRRKDNDKSFKGSVFVEFDSEETMKKFLDLDPKPEYQGKPLQIMTKKEYCEKKAADIASGKIRANSPVGGGRKNRDDRNWKERRADDNRRDNRHRRGGGRGFGSKGGRDQDRGDRNRERNPNKDSTNAEDREAANTSAVAQAKAFVEAEKAKEEDTNGTAGQKRAREEDKAEGEREAKKADTKSEES